MHRHHAPHACMDWYIDVHHDHVCTFNMQGNCVLLVPPKSFFLVLSSQTLRVPPSQADTIWEPFGEYATDTIGVLCALAFSVLSSSVAV